ncbi:hypothetical protein AB35_4513 [Escherichia coli 2-474-04_S1_C2]|nr:hypothetical protein HMPREF9543_04726 [Escherichia coli MS 146-1]KDY99573.1 hypothetical protein AB35_4513 [Escherichia coli 2-474-04_S1_C2]
MQRRGKGCFTESARSGIIDFTPGNTVCTVFGAPDFRLLQQPFHALGTRICCVRFVP